MDLTIFTSRYSGRRIAIDPEDIKMIEETSDTTCSLIIRSDDGRTTHREDVMESFESVLKKLDIKLPKVIEEKTSGIVDIKSSEGSKVVASRTPPKTTTIRKPTKGE